MRTLLLLALCACGLDHEHAIDVAAAIHDATALPGDSGACHPPETGTFVRTESTIALDDCLDPPWALSLWTKQPLAIVPIDGNVPTADVRGTVTYKTFTDDEGDCDIALHITYGDPWVVTGTVDHQDITFGCEPSECHGAHHTY